MPQPEPPKRPTYIGIHARDSGSQLLYVSSGVREALGFTPAQMLSLPAETFVADSHGDYMRTYDEKANEGADNGDDDANAYLMYLNVKRADGSAVLHRVITFKCDNCILAIAQALPEVPFRNKRELQVQMLDGAKRQVNVTREKEAQGERRRRNASTRAHRSPLYCSRDRVAKAAFVLENPDAVSTPTAQCGNRNQGPLTVFVTGTISHIIEADPSDVMRYPFLKLVAPEDVVHAGRYFERLSDTTDVQCETFSLLKHPHIIDGDIFVADEENPRIVVEALGAAVDDGVVFMIRKLRTIPPPKRGSMGDYVHAWAPEADNEGGYLSLAEMISSDPDTSDAPGLWSLLS